MYDTVQEDCPPGLPRCSCACGPGFDCSQPPPFSWGFEGPEPAIPNLSMPTEQANHPSDLCSLRWRTDCPRQGILPCLLSSLTSERAQGCTQQADKPGQACVLPLPGCNLWLLPRSFVPLHRSTGRRMCKNLNSFRLLLLSSQSSHFGRAGGAEPWSFGSTKH